MKALIFGAGAIGSYIGGSLVLAGQQVVFLEQVTSAKKLRDQGLHLTIPGRSGSPFTIPSSAFQVVTTIPEAIQNAQFDIGIFALKSFDTAALLVQMQAYAQQMPPILCLSNGVENEAALASVLGSDKVIPGTVTSSVARQDIGDIVLEMMRGVGIAEKHPLSLYLWEIFNSAGLNAHLYRRPDDMKWSKMLTNLMVNSSVAILDMPPQAVLSHPGLFELEIAMLREALAVMKAQGIHVVDLPKTPVRLLALAARLPSFIGRPLLVRAVGGGRGGKMPSFHIDLHSGRGKSEVEWLNGAVARFGEKCHVPTPVNMQITRLLSALTRGEKPLSEFSQQPEKLITAIKGDS